VRPRTDNIEAYDDVLRGYAYHWTFTQQALAKAREMFQKAVALDPKYADPYAGMGWTYFEDWAFQWNRDPQLRDRALELGRQAIALDDSNTDAYALLSAVETSEEQYDRAIADSEHAIAVDPNYTFGYVWLAEALTKSGRPADGIACTEKVMRLDPRNRDQYVLVVGLAYFAMGRYKESVSAYKQSLVRWGKSPGPHLGLAVDYVELGRDEEARAETAEVLRFNPRFSPRSVFKDPALNERYIADLRKAGLK
jgi:adenylate cyclase